MTQTWEALAGSYQPDEQIFLALMLLVPRESYLPFHQTILFCFCFYQVLFPQRQNLRALLNYKTRRVVPYPMGPHKPTQGGSRKGLGGQLGGEGVHDTTRQTSAKTFPSIASVVRFPESETFFL